MAQYAHLSTPDPEWAEISAKLTPAKPVESIQTYREEIVKNGRMPAQANVEAEFTDLLSIIETKIPVENGEIRVKAYIPRAQEGETSGYPLLNWMYGGGFVIGIIENDEPFLRRLAVHCRIVCVCGDYRKAPEYPFPIPVNDNYAIFKWALSNASELSIDSSKGVIVGGASAGGNFAAVLAQRALKDPQLKGVITGQFLVMPTVISLRADPGKFKSELLSIDEDADKYCLTKNQMLAFSKAYHADDEAANPEVSPALAESFEGLPPAYIQICGLDPLRDEAFLYERLLKEAGVSTRVDIYPGLPHGFPVFFPNLTASKKQGFDFIQGLQWLLRRIE